MWTVEAALDQPWSWPHEKKIQRWRWRRQQLLIKIRRSKELKIFRSQLWKTVVEFKTRNTTLSVYNFKLMPTFQWYLPHPVVWYLPWQDCSKARRCCWFFATVIIGNGRFEFKRRTLTLLRFCSGWFVHIATEILFKLKFGGLRCGMFFSHIK